ncbi:MAG: sodium:solute symporter family protein [Oscillospiraceae bacterium]|nr:sodium:solute symporter family protein [Oscillospiraceae bacterium]
MALAIALVYFVALIVIATLYTKRKVKTAQDFRNAGDGMGWALVTFCFVLVPLGSGHTLSLWETAANGQGATAMWWGIGAGAIFLPLMMLWFGPWVRQTRLGSVPAIIEKMFGRDLGAVHACFQTMTWAGIGTAELCAIGTAIYGLSGGAISYRPWCIIIGLILAIFYVFFGGVLQMAWLNVINSIVLIVGSYISLIMVAVWVVANLGGLDAVVEFYNASLGGAHLLSNMNLDRPDVWLQTIIPVIVLHSTCGAVSQCMNQPFFAAKDDQACRRGVFLGAGMNMMSCVPWVLMACIGVAIASVVARAEAGGEVAKLIVPSLALETLPTPIVGLLMISLLSATLSTAGSIFLGNGNVIATDIIKRAWKPNMSDKEHLKWLRVCVLIQAIICGIAALKMDVLFTLFLWCFSFGMPVFVVYFLGMIWKSSKVAAWITIVVSYVVGIIWTFWPPAFMNNILMGIFALNIYMVMAVSIILGVILTAVLPGEPGLRTKKYKEKYGFNYKGDSVILDQPK